MCETIHVLTWTPVCTYAIFYQKLWRNSSDIDAINVYIFVYLNITVHTQSLCPTNFHGKNKWNLFHLKLILLESISFKKFWSFVLNRRIFIFNCLIKFSIWPFEINLLGEKSDTHPLIGELWFCFEKENNNILKKGEFLKSNENFSNFACVECE